MVRLEIQRICILQLGVETDEKTMGLFILPLPESPLGEYSIRCLAKSSKHE
jgi:hypothetical protein